MKAMIFAAGLGTRLRPYTNDRPKALVEVAGKPLIEWAIRRLLYCGFDELVINVHHFGQQIIDFLNQHNGFGAHIIISDERGLLLNTGGGLKKAADHLQDAPFLIYNTDVLSDIPLDALYQQHCHSDALATLVVRERESSRYLLFDENKLLSGWRHARTGEEKIAREVDASLPYAFSGIHIARPDIFDYMPDIEVFSIIDVYLNAAQHEKLQGYIDTSKYWLDVGKLPALEKAAQLVPHIPFAGVKQKENR
jgi:NDP-sugar pyrophosphorylase family protein